MKQEEDSIRGPENTVLHGRHLAGKDSFKPLKERKKKTKKKKKKKKKKQQEKIFRRRSRDRRGCPTRHSKRKGDLCLIKLEGTLSHGRHGSGMQGGSQGKVKRERFVRAQTTARKTRPGYGSVLRRQVQKHLNIHELQWRRGRIKGTISPTQKERVDPGGTSGDLELGPK